MAKVEIKMGEIGGGGLCKTGHATIPSNDATTFTDIGFEPTYFAWYASNSSVYEFGVDDYTNNLHFYGQKRSSSPTDSVFNTSRITSKSASSVTVDSPYTSLRGSEMYYIAIG